MYRRRTLSLLACATAALALSACNQPAGEPPGTNAVPGATAPAGAAAPLTGDAQIERGRMLVIGGGCHDCHTPKKFGPAGPEFDYDRALSGHPESAKIDAPFKQDPKSPWTTHTNDHLTAWSGAWGVSFAANITGDTNTGIGIWTEKMFIDAMRTGKHMGTSRQILPPMPWNFYGQLPDEDLKALLAYLKSTKPIANRVPVPLGPDGKPIEEPQ
jgi:mono/diheme cytochrome c family protein